MKRLAAVLTLGALCLATEVRAQETPTADSAAEARAQYTQGTQAFQAKRYSEAALHFEAAAAFRVNAVALYTAGLAWDLASKPERAADAYARALEVQGLDAKQTKTAKDRIDALHAADPGNPLPVPVDLVTSSASGLDPHISLAYADLQVNRVAKARGLNPDLVRSMVAQHTDGRTLGFFGEPRVNVLELNIALDGL